MPLPFGNHRENLFDEACCYVPGAIFPEHPVLLPMIDRGDIRQAIDRCSNIWASLPGAGYGQYEHKIGDLIARFKEAGGVVNEAEL